jgi:hypothetical protein
MLGLSFFVACGACLTIGACVTGESVIPLISILLGFMALITVCTFDLLHVDHGMPAALMDSAEEGGAVTRSDLGWLLCGIFLTGAWCCPLIVARHQVLSMRTSWLSSLGTWALVGALGLFLLFLSKGRQDQGFDY